MQYIRQIRAVLTQTESGIFVPTGSEQDSTGYDSTTFPSIKQQAERIESLFATNGVSLRTGCGLAQIVKQTNDVVDCWSKDNKANISSDILTLKIAHFNRIADAILRLETIPDCREYLHRLTDGIIDNITPGCSVAKNTLWELELWSTMVKRGVMARLLDPPDIVMTIDNFEIAVACKKLYSEKHVQNILSEAVRQICLASNFGVVALNIDELGAAGNFFDCNSFAQATDALDRMNQTFLAKHERHLRKYLADERIVGALVSSGCVADLRQEKPRLNFARMNTIWCLPDISEAKKRCLLALQKAFYN